MLFKISEIVLISPFLKNWKGTLKSNFKNQHSKLALYFSTGKDFEINITFIKFIQKYDLSTFNKMINIGFCMKFQSFNIIVFNKYGRFNCICISDEGIDCGSVIIDKNGQTTKLSKYANSDIEYLIIYLCLDVNFKYLDLNQNCESDIKVFFDKDLIKLSNHSNIKQTKLNKVKSSMTKNEEFQSYEDLLNSLEVN